MVWMTDYPGLKGMYSLTLVVLIAQTSHWMTKGQVENKRDHLHGHFSALSFCFPFGTKKSSLLNAIMKILKRLSVILCCLVGLPPIPPTKIKRKFSRWWTRKGFCQWSFSHSSFDSITQLFLHTPTPLVACPGIERLSSRVNDITV